MQPEAFGHWLPICTPTSQTTQSTNSWGVLFSVPLLARCIVSRRVTNPGGSWIFKETGAIKSPYFKLTEISPQSPNFGADSRGPSTVRGYVRVVVLCFPEIEVVSRVFFFQRSMGGMLSYVCLVTRSRYSLWILLLCYVGNRNNLRALSVLLIISYSVTTMVKKRWWNDLGIPVAVWFYRFLSIVAHAGAW